MGELTYLAGYFDGEGCITITTGKHKRSNKIREEIKAVIAINSCSKQSLELFKKRFGGNIYLKKPHKGWKQSWQWMITTKQASNFCKIMKDKLKEKKKQAEIVLELQKTKLGVRRFPYIVKKQQRLLKKIQLLNGMSGRKNKSFYK